MTTQQITAVSGQSTRRYWIGSYRRFDRYNRSLVKRIEDLMEWKSLLKENSHGKRGHPHKTPNAFITFLAKLRTVYNVPFRSLEAIARIFSWITGIAAISYTSIFRRIRKNQANNP